MKMLTPLGRVALFLDGLKDRAIGTGLYVRGHAKLALARALRALSGMIDEIRMRYTQ